MLLLFSLSVVPNSLCPPGLRPTGLLCPPGIPQLRMLEWAAILPSRVVTRAACKVCVMCFPLQWWPAWTQGTCPRASPRVLSMQCRVSVSVQEGLLSSGIFRPHLHGKWPVGSLSAQVSGWVGSSGLSCRRALKERCQHNTCFAFLSIQKGIDFLFYLTASQIVLVFMISLKKSPNTTQN